MALEHVLVGATVFTLGSVTASIGLFRRAFAHNRAAAQARDITVAAQAEALKDTNVLVDVLCGRLREHGRHDERVTELLEANNRYQAEARAARADGCAYLETIDRLGTELARLNETATRQEEEIVAYQEAIENLEVELTASRRDAEANEGEANRWAGIAHELGYQPAVAVGEGTTRTLQ